VPVVRAPQNSRPAVVVRLRRCGRCALVRRRDLPPRHGIHPRLFPGAPLRPLHPTRPAARAALLVLRARPAGPRLPLDAALCSSAPLDLQGLSGAALRRRGRLRLSLFLALDQQAAGLPAAPPARPLSPPRTRPGANRRAPARARRLWPSSVLDAPRLRRFASNPAARLTARLPRPHPLVLSCVSRSRGRGRLVARQ